MKKVNGLQNKDDRVFPTLFIEKPPSEISEESNLTDIENLLEIRINNITSCKIIVKGVKVNVMETYSQSGLLTTLFTFIYNSDNYSLIGNVPLHLYLKRIAVELRDTIFQKYFYSYSIDDVVSNMELVIDLNIKPKSLSNLKNSKKKIRNFFKLHLRFFKLENINIEKQEK